MESTKSLIILPLIASVGIGLISVVLTIFIATAIAGTFDFTTCLAFSAMILIGVISFLILRKKSAKMNLSFIVVCWSIIALIIWSGDFGDFDDGEYTPNQSLNSSPETGAN